MKNSFKYANIIETKTKVSLLLHTTPLKIINLKYYQQNVIFL